MQLSSSNSAALNFLSLVIFANLFLPCFQMVLDLLTRAHSVELLIDSPSTSIEMDLLKALRCLQASSHQITEVSEHESGHC